MSDTTTASTETQEQTTTQAAATTEQSTTSTQQQTSTENTQQSTTPSFTGDLPDNWFLQLGDEYSQAGDDLGKHKNIKSLITERDFFRSKQVAYPGEEASQSDVAAFRERAQVPAAGTIEAYGIADLLPENASDHDKAMFDRLAKVAYDNHIPAPGFQKAISEFLTIQGEEMQLAQDAQQKHLQAAQDDLIKAWGQDYDANASTVRHYTQKFAEVAGIHNEAEIAGLANNPTFAKIMMQVARITGEDSTKSPVGIGDMRSLQQQVDAIHAGTDPVWGQRYQDRDPEAQRHYMKLMSQLHPST